MKYSTYKAELDFRAPPLFTHHPGFTLIELMTVVVVIGILAAIAIPNYMTLKNRALEASVKSNMHSILMAVEEFCTLAEGTYPGDLDTRVCDVCSNPSVMSLAAGARIPPFPATALVGDFGNPFSQNDNVVDNLLVGPPPPTPPGPPGNPRGCVYYSSYQLDGVTPGVAGQPAFSYNITAYGADVPIKLILP